MTGQEELNPYPLYKSGKLAKGFKRPKEWKKPGRKPSKRTRQETTCFRIPTGWLDCIDELVEQQLVKSRSDFIRRAIRNELIIHNYHGLVIP